MATNDGGPAANVSGDSDSPRSLRIHVVDDEPQVLVVLAKMVERTGLLVAMHRTAEDLLRQFRVGESCCVVLDLTLPDVDGRTLLTELLARDPALPVIMISGKANIRAAVECVKMGASSFLEKPVEPRHLSDAITEGLARSAARRTKIERAEEIEQRIQALTPREREVMGLLRTGQTVKQIAFELGISHKTIQVHRSRILDRMHVNSLVDLANLLHEKDESLAEVLPHASNADAVAARSSARPPQQRPTPREAAERLGEIDPGF